MGSSASPCTEERALWCSFGTLLIWNGYIKVDVSFLGGAQCFCCWYVTHSCFWELLLGQGLGSRVSRRWHFWSLFLSAESREASHFKSVSWQCHLSRREWQSEILLFSITGLNCCPSLGKVTVSNLNSCTVAEQGDAAFIFSMLSLTGWFAKWISWKNQCKKRSASLSL